MSSRVATFFPFSAASWSSRLVRLTLNGPLSFIRRPRWHRGFQFLPMLPLVQVSPLAPMLSSAQVFSWVPAVPSVAVQLWVRTAV